MKHEYIYGIQEHLIITNHNVTMSLTFTRYDITTPGSIDWTSNLHWTAYISVAMVTATINYWSGWIHRQRFTGYWCIVHCHSWTITDSNYKIHQFIYIFIILIHSQNNKTILVHKILKQYWYNARFFLRIKFFSRYNWSLALVDYCTLKLKRKQRVLIWNDTSPSNLVELF